MTRDASNHLLLWTCIVCALLPLILLINDLNWSARMGEALFFTLAGGLIPAIWLGATIAYYRRVRTKAAKWLFALTPVAFLYPLGALLLAIAVLVKPGRW
jgi:hypothetical protein